MSSKEVTAQNSRDPQTMKNESNSRRSAVFQPTEKTSIFSVTFPPRLSSKEMTVQNFRSKESMKRNLLTFCALVLALASVHLNAAPLGTAFAYQGRLTDGANPPNGRYDL